ncbi:MAG: N-acetylmuramic acid 6-phosphate etherase [Candidatus Bruticola sp.]
MEKAAAAFKLFCLFESDIDELMQNLTEASNPLSLHLDKMTPLELVQLMNSEDAKAVLAVKAALPTIAECIKAITDKLKNGGRLFYFGAGTSGRLGVLDAAECPPTFGTDPQQVQAIIAGGPGALIEAVENAEDDREAAYVELSKRSINSGDFALGITASGSTPFVLGGLRRLREAGIETGAIFCNPGAQAATEADFPILLAVGPEVLRGSTRLKAGTATKLALNMISTGVMVSLGHCAGNMMIDVKASNAKLVKRQVEMAASLAKISFAEAQQALKKANGSLREALANLQSGQRG